jgi:hypothetical protein
MKFSFTFRRLLTILALTMLVLATWPALPAQALVPSPTLTVTGLTRIGCANSTTTLNLMVSNVTLPSTLYYRTLVDAGGVRYMDQVFGPVSANGAQAWSLFFSNTGGTATNAWPIPPETPITVQILLTNGAAGLTVTRTVTILSKCNGGSIVITPNWTVTSLTSVGCNSSNIGFSTETTNLTFPTTLHFRTQVDAGGIRYMDEDAGNPSSNGTFNWHLYFSSTGGPAINSWPIPPNTPITVWFLLIDGVGGPTVSSSIIHLSKCNGGSIYNLFSSYMPLITH